MLKKRIYLAGPVSRGPLVHNVNQATAAFVALAKAGFAPFAPQLSVYCRPCRPHAVGVVCVGTVAGNDEMSYEDWMQVDLPWVEASDAVLRLPGESVGADREVAHARERGIPVFDSVASVEAYFARVRGVA